MRTALIKVTTLLPTNLDGLRHLGYLRTSESETGAEDKILEGRCVAA
jgi:hypothetical protein